MKKIVFLLILLIVTVSIQAQTKSGIVYSEHPTIKTTKVLMKALQDGDQDGFISFFADSVYFITNGDGQQGSRDNLKGVVRYWSAFADLEIKDAYPAYPDAIEYNEGGTWVQDWLLFTATHKKTGIKIKEPFHQLYRFNKEGKIDVFSGYFNNDVFDEISNRLNPSSLPAEDQEYILNNYKVVEEKWNNGDRTAYINRYNEKTFYMLPNQEMLEGIDAIKAFVNSGSASKSELEAVEIWGSSNFATVRGIYKSFDSQGKIANKGKFISNWKKDSEGTWKISHDIWNSDFAPATN